MKVNPEKFIRKSMFGVFLLTLILALFSIFVKVDNSVDCNGVIEPAEKYQVRSEISGIINTINFENGSRVEEGDVILELKDDELRINLEKAILQYKIMVSKYNNEYKEAERLFLSKKRLYNENLISYDEYYQSKLEYEMILLGQYDIEQIRLNNESISNKLAKTLIETSISGKIIYDENKLVYGNFVNMGEELFKVVNYENTGNIIAKILIPENVSSRVQLSNVVRIFITAFPYIKYKAIDGILYYISPISENGFFTGKVALENIFMKVDDIEKPLSVGMTLSAKIIIGEIPIYKMLLGIKE